MIKFKQIILQQRLISFNKTISQYPLTKQQVMQFKNMIKEKLSLQSVDHIDKTLNPMTVKEIIKSGDITLQQFIKYESLSILCPRVQNVFYITGFYNIENLQMFVTYFYKADSSTQPFSSQEKLRFGIDYIVKCNISYFPIQNTNYQNKDGVIELVKIVEKMEDNYYNSKNKQNIIQYINILFNDNYTQITDYQCKSERLFLKCLCKKYTINYKKISLIRLQRINLYYNVSIKIPQITIIQKLQYSPIYYISNMIDDDNITQLIKQLNSNTPLTVHLLKDLYSETIYFDKVKISIENNNVIFQIERLELNSAQLKTMVKHFGVYYHIKYVDKMVASKSSITINSYCKIGGLSIKQGSTVVVANECIISKFNIRNNSNLIINVDKFTTSLDIDFINNGNLISNKGKSVLYIKYDKLSPSNFSGHIQNFFINYQQANTRFGFYQTEFKNCEIINIYSIDSTFNNCFIKNGTFSTCKLVDTKIHRNGQIYVRDNITINGETTQCGNTFISIYDAIRNLPISYSYN